MELIFRFFKVLVLMILGRRMNFRNVLIIVLFELFGFERVRINILICVNI